MTDLTNWDDGNLGEGETDDDIIELVDVVKVDPEDSNDEQLIELTDLVEEESVDLDLDMVTEESVELDEGLGLDEEIFEDPGLELDTDDHPEEGSPESGASLASIQGLNVSDDQVKAVLEEVIEKKFGDKIEKILFEVMEKVIEKEIAAIKASLQKNLD